jgi:molybdopterin-guanine dinucleotide biosynthesis protein
MVARIIAISGAQSTGKSTLLEALRAKGHHVDSFKAARYVLKEMDLPLYEINKNVELTKTFQKRILELKYKNDLELKYKYGPEDIVFVERYPGDIFAFAKIWAKGLRDDDFSKWIDITFYSDCKTFSNIYDACFILPSGKIAHEYDGIRAKEDTQFDVDDWIKHFTARHWCDINFVHPRFYNTTIQNCDIIKRVEEVEKAVEEAKEYYDSGIDGFYKSIKKSAVSSM